MTPADLVMRNALHERALYPHSPPARASEAQSLLDDEPRRNLTTFGIRAPTSSEHVESSRNKPATPHLTLHEFRKYQQSPSLSSSSDIDYKRVRRKQHFANLSRTSLQSTPAILPTTSPSSSSFRFAPPRNLLPSLLPPSPRPLIPRPSTYSPSLSSTGDTLESASTYTPIQDVSPLTEGWSGSERSEPIRTKRKFARFKQAKRLPHCPAPFGVWEVHAVVHDVGGTGLGIQADSREEESSEHVTSEESEQDLRRAQAAQQSSGRQARSVRFEGVGTESSSGKSRSSRAGQEKGSSSTSSYSLSRYQFPPPPGFAWAGTFGHLNEPTPPTSPATLQYEGVSFDVVNPHTSLLLGVPEFETPGEIDGLLDDYFERRESSQSMAYHHIPKEADSPSQQSLQTSSSEGRRRVLYDDPDSARRDIMRLPAGASQHPIISSPYQDSPLFRRSNTSQSTSGGIQQEHGVHTHRDVEAANEASRRLQNLRERLGVRLYQTQDVNQDEFETVDLNENLGAVGGAVVENREPGHMNFVSGDRASSVYPHSQRSNPFDLTVSDDGDDDRGFNNIDHVVAGGRESAYAGNSAYYDREGDFTVYEDGADADARTESTLEPETTVGNIVSHYQYRRSPLSDIDTETLRERDSQSQSRSAEGLRGLYRDQDPMRQHDDGSQYNVDTSSFEDPRRASRMVSPPSFAYEHHESARGPVRGSGPPHMPPPVSLPPTPPHRSAMRFGSDVPFPDNTPPTTTDRTYGNTGQLLLMTSEGERISVPTPRPGEGPPIYFDGRGGSSRARFSSDLRVDQTPRRDYSQALTTHGSQAIEMRAIFDADEDKENTPPDRSASEASLMLGQARTFRPTYSDVRHQYPPGSVDMGGVPNMLRSSSYYPEDDDANSMWESIHESESRNNLAGLASRPSQESYANTSHHGSQHRLSLPPGDLDADMEAGPSSQPRILRAMVVPTSWRHVAETDEKKARKLLEANMLEDALVGKLLNTPKQDKFQFASDMKDLERLRENERAAAKGVGSSSKLTKLKPVYSPQTSFSKAKLFGRKQESRESVASEQRGLLSYRGSPVPGGSLRFSETANTFKTVTTKPFSSSIYGRPVESYSPLSPPPLTPPASALLRDKTNPFRSPGSIERPDTLQGEQIEMQRFRRKPASRAAMSGQTALQPLQLVANTTNSGRMTEAQLIAAEPGWTNEPDYSSTGALARQGGEFPRDLEAGAASVCGGTIMLPSLLMRPEEARSYSRKLEQAKLTRRYYILSLISPVTCLVFAFGGLDWRMRQMTKGEIVEMLPESKSNALWPYFPLGLMFWGIAGLMIALLVVYVAGDV